MGNSTDFPPAFNTTWSDTGALLFRTYGRARGPGAGGAFRLPQRNNYRIRGHRAGSDFGLDAAAVDCTRAGRAMGHRGQQKTRNGCGFLRHFGLLKWWPGRESNPRHGDFQSPALPTELPGRTLRRWAVRARHHTDRVRGRQAGTRRPPWCATGVTRNRGQSHFPPYSPGMQRSGRKVTLTPVGRKVTLTPAGGKVTLPPAGHFRTS